MDTDRVVDGSDEEPTVFEPTPRSIEIEVPSDPSIFFYKAGIKVGLESMEQCKKLLTLAGDMASVRQISNAAYALSAFLDAVIEVETDIVQEFREAQQQQAQQVEVEAAFVPRIEEEPKK